MYAHVKIVNAPCVLSAFKYDPKKYVRKQKYMELQRLAQSKKDKDQQH